MDNLAALTIVGITFIIVGLLLRYFTPGINKFYGYRTKTSMASKANWDFSQKYSGALFAIFGLLLLLIAITITIGYAEINIENNWGKFTVVILILCSIITTIVMTERAMKKQCN